MTNGQEVNGKQCLDKALYFVNKGYDFTRGRMQDLYGINSEIFFRKTHDDSISR